MFEPLERRMLLTSWLLELPGDQQFVAVDQLAHSDTVCLAFIDSAEGIAGHLRLTAPPGDEPAVEETVRYSASFGPPQLVDAAFRDDGAFQAGGSVWTSQSLVTGEGEPAIWTDGVERSVGLDLPFASNSGAIHAVGRDGRAVGQDNLRPIVHDADGTEPLPVFPKSVIGAAFDLNRNRIAGYIDDAAVVWTQDDDRWVPTRLERQPGDSFGTANAISEYGIVGGSHRPAGQGSTTIGVLWDRDGNRLREFSGDAAGDVTHVIDYLAAIETEHGSLVYSPWDDAVRTLDQFFREIGGIEVADEPLKVIDLERSDDGERILILYEPVGEQAPDSTRPQSLASLPLDQLPIGATHPWNRYDVNNDGRVTPLDALLVINRVAQSPFTDIRPGGAAAGRFYDVSKDGSITPLDALRVINRLARQF